MTRQHQNNNHSVVPPKKQTQQNKPVTVVSYVPKWQEPAVIAPTPVRSPSNYSYVYKLCLDNKECYAVDSKNTKIENGEACISLAAELIPNNGITQLKPKNRPLTLELRKYDGMGNLFQILVFKDPFITEHNVVANERTLKFKFFKVEEKR